MMKILKSLGMVDCQGASQLASDRLERPLSLGETISIYLHLLICKPCVNFNKQLRFMQKANATANEHAPVKPDTGLSDKTRERLRRQLSQTPPRSS